MIDDLVLYIEYKDALNDAAREYVESIDFFGELQDILEILTL